MKSPRSTVFQSLEAPPRVAKPRPRSAFPRPTGLRQTLNTVQQAATAERYVTTADELRGAIAEIASAFKVDDNGFPTSIGGAIVVAKSFGVAETVVIPPRASLITIRGIGGATIVPESPDQGTLFKVQGIFVTIRDLFVFYQTAGGSPSAWFNTLVELEHVVPEIDNITPENCHVIDNVFFGDRLFVDGTTDAGDECLVEGNFVTEANGTHAACVVLNSRTQIVRDNWLSDGGGDAVTVGPSGRWARVVGNDCADGDITSSGSAGSNVIAENVRVGTISRHGSDAVGLNR